MQIGKLPNDVLRDIVISKINKFNEDVIVGPQVGEDCSVVKFNDDVCVLTTDPITAADRNMGKIGVHICCNDIASAGVRPLGILVTILAPPSVEISDIKNIMKDVTSACEEMSIDILGGHTEITDAVNRTVISITAIGKGKANKFVRTGGALEGDDIIVTGYAGLEGTAIISRDYYEALSNIVSRDVLLSAQEMLKDISVVKTGLIAAEYGVNAMHDATEGGILGAIWEVAEASSLGAYIEQDNIPISSETLEICKAININPFRLISSGSMVITCKAGEGLCNLLKERGINAAVVGKITKEEKVIKNKFKEEILSPPESDEIYNVELKLKERLTGGKNE